MFFVSFICLMPCFLLYNLHKGKDLKKIPYTYSNLCWPNLCLWGINSSFTHIYMSVEWFSNSVQPSLFLGGFQKFIKNWFFLPGEYYFKSDFHFLLWFYCYGVYDCPFIFYFYLYFVMFLVLPYLWYSLLFVRLQQ